MKKIQLSGLMILTAIIVNACGGGQPPPTPPEEPAEDTTTYIPEDTIPPEPEVRTISESEFVIVYFDFDKSHIKPEFETAIENNAALMKESMDMVLRNVKVIRLTRDFVCPLAWDDMKVRPPEATRLVPFLEELEFNAMAQEMREGSLDLE